MNQAGPSVTAGKSKIKAFGLVRDKNGKPKIDDINNIPTQIWDMLTNKEPEEIENGRNS